MVVIGGGFIGLEVAAAARKAGKAVTVVEAVPRLMARAVPPVLSDFFLDLHRAEGAEVRLNSAVAELQPDAVILTDGSRSSAELVVAGIGVVPNTELARDAGLAVANGIAVDEFLRTSDPDIFAIGDCADYPNIFAGGRARLESVQNAVDQAKSVARAIAGQPAPYRDVPWFWTDQFEIRFQMAGLSAGHDQSVVRGSVEGRKFSAFLFQGRAIAGRGFDQPLRRSRRGAQDAGRGNAAYRRSRPRTRRWILRNWPRLKPRDDADSTQEPNARASRMNETSVEGDNGVAAGLCERRQVSVGPEIGTGAALPGDVTPVCFETRRFTGILNAVIRTQGIVDPPCALGVEHVLSHDAAIGQSPQEALLRYPAKNEPLRSQLNKPLSRHRVMYMSNER